MALLGRLVNAFDRFVTAHGQLDPWIPSGINLECVVRLAVSSRYRAAGLELAAAAALARR